MKTDMMFACHSMEGAMTGAYPVTLCLDVCGHGVLLLITNVMLLIPLGGGCRVDGSFVSGSGQRLLRSLLAIYEQVRLQDGFQ